MPEIINKKYDLEERTLTFAKNTRIFLRKIYKDICNLEDSKQLARSSGSVHANYIEANEALSKKDFLMRVKICRKEAKESTSWLTLIETSKNAELEKEKNALIKESTELLKIFSAIVSKSV